MSREIDDIEGALATESQALAPNAANGSPVGRSEAREAQPLPEVVNVPPVVLDAPVGHTPASDARPQTQRCPTCAKKRGEAFAIVIPSPKGACPVCGIFLRLNFAARRHPVNLARRDAILADLVAQFAPANIVERADCENLATAMEALEPPTKPGTTEWGRMIETKQILSASLRESQACRTRDPRPITTDLMSNAALALMQSLLSRIEAGEVLNQFDEGRLAVLRGAMYGEFLLPADPVDAEPVPPSATYDPTTDDAPVESTVPALPVEEPTPPKIDACPYCYKSHADCAALRDQRPDVFASLHRQHPDEVKKRDDAAFKEMLLMMPLSRRGYR